MIRGWLGMQEPMSLVDTGSAGDGLVRQPFG
jgi:hypothetical protein